MKIQVPEKLKDGDQRKVVAGIHAGKAGTMRDINTSKTRHIIITVVQENGDRFKTLGGMWLWYNIAFKNDNKFRYVYEV